METIEIDGMQYEVTGHGDDGLPIVRGIATSVPHKDENGKQIFDEDGNPKISVNITVPAADLFAVPGENGQ